MDGQPGTEPKGAPAPEEPTPGVQALCPRCGADLGHSNLYQRFKVCERCGYHFPIGVLERIAMLADPGTFVESNRDLVSSDPLGFTDRMPYPEHLESARARTGLNEAVVTGTARIGGHECVLALLDFGFLGGTMGTVVGEKVTLALELAADRKIPCVAFCSSGGARMQEGMLSLVQMAKTNAASMFLHMEHVPYITVLTHPTTGGVYASFGNQGDVILAEPGALVGFAGPRVIEQTTGEEAPRGTHSSEFLLAHGMVDNIVPRPRMRDTLGLLLGLFSVRFRVTHRPHSVAALPGPGQTPVRAAWETVQLARRHDRPTSLTYIRRILHGFVELHGDRLYGDDPAVVTGVGETAGRAVVVIAQERGHGQESERRRHGRMFPEGYRKAIRMLRLAARWRLPVLTFIDTPGAYPGFEAEARGLAMALSECMGMMLAVPVPTVAAVIGEGASGGALVLGVADRILMQENATYSVIAPEGAAAILYRDSSRAPELAEGLKLTARDCLSLGIVDTLVPEPEGGAHLDPDYATAQLRDYLREALISASEVDRGNRLVEERYRKFRRMGREFVRLEGGGGYDVGDLSRRSGRFSNAWGRLRLIGDEIAGHLPHRGDDNQDKDRR